MQLHMLLLSRFSRVRLCATPWTAAHQAPSSLGFSRQEHWSGVPLPSPMQESEKWSCPVVSDPQRPRGLQPSRLLRPWDFPGKSTGVGCHCLNLYLYLKSSFFPHFFKLVFWPCHTPWGILVSWPGMEPSTWQWERWVLTTGPPGNSYLDHF